MKASRRSRHDIQRICRHLYQRPQITFNSDNEWTDINSRGETLPKISSLTNPQKVVDYPHLHGTAQRKCIGSNEDGIT